jgi:DNA repair protein RadC
VYIVRELTVKYRCRRIGGTPHRHGPLTTPREAAELFSRILRQEIIEVCGLLCLSAKQEVTAYHELSRGTTDCTMVHPRDVFRTALLGNAVSILVAHNHPSGDATPSRDDHLVTARLDAAGGLIGIQLQDHIIIGAAERYFSFREAGNL